MAGTNQVLLTFAGEDKSLGRTVDQVGRKLDGFGSQAESGTQRAGAGFSRAGESMRKFGTQATGFVSVPIVAAFGAAQQASSNLAEAQNATNVVFGDAAGIITAAGENAAQSMGLSERAFREAVTPMGAMLTNLGFSQEDAANSSIMLSQRASDMASVFNTDVGTALEAINSGLRGEADPLEQFGVGLNEAAVNAKAMELGLGDSTGALTDSEKMQARLALIMDQTNGIAGDFAATSDEAANKQRIMAAEAENAAAQFGDNLQPIMDRMLGILGGLLDKFNNLSPGMQQFIMYAGLALVALGPLVTVIGTLSTVIGFLAANPIVLVIAAIAALVVGIIWAYNNVGWFRDLVQGAFAIIGAVISGVFNWVTSNWPVLLAVLTGPIGLAVLVITRHWDTIKNGVIAVKDWIVGAFDSVVGFVTGLPGRIGGAASGMWDGITSAFKSAINTIIGWWNNLSFPSLTVGGQSLGPLGELPSFTFGGWELPNIPVLHQGGRVPGAPGTETMALLQAGEHVSRAGAPQQPAVVINVAGSIRSDRDLVKVIRDELARGGMRGVLR